MTSIFNLNNQNDLHPLAVSQNYVMWRNFTFRSEKSHNYSHERYELKCRRFVIRLITFFSRLHTSLVTSKSVEGNRKSHSELVHIFTPWNHRIKNKSLEVSCRLSVLICHCLQIAVVPLWRNLKIRFIPKKVIIDENISACKYNTNERRRVFYVHSFIHLFIHWFIPTLTSQKLLVHYYVSDAFFLSTWMKWINRKCHYFARIDVCGLSLFAISSSCHCSAPIGVFISLSQPNRQRAPLWRRKRNFAEIVWIKNLWNRSLFLDDAEMKMLYQ